MTRSQILTAAGLALGVTALLLELAVQVSARLGSGVGILGAAGRYFSYFTILGNLLVVLIYLSALYPSGKLSWFGRSQTRGMAVAMITQVMLVYGLIIAPTDNVHGLARLSAALAHYMTPVLHLAWWALFVRHGDLRLRAVPAMLVPSLIYMTYVLVRGGVLGEYPYAMLDANRIGAGAVALHGVAMLVLLVLLCATVVWIDGLLLRARPPRFERSDHVA